MNSLTVNLHLMMVSFFAPPRAAQDVDRAVRVSLGSLRRRFAARVPRPDAAQHLIEIAAAAGRANVAHRGFAARIEREGPGLALVLLPGVQYLSGQSLELEPLIAAARACRRGRRHRSRPRHRQHATLALHDWGADFAVWCSLQVSECGPGRGRRLFRARASCQAPDLPRFAGWWGHDKAERFDMGAEVRSHCRAPRAGRSAIPRCWSTGAAARVARGLRARRHRRLREKSLALTGYMRRLIEARLADAGRDHDAGRSRRSTAAN